MSRVEEVLMMVKHVPPFPKVAQRVMELLENPDTTAAQLAEVIQFDSAITANVLKICNAAYFGLPRKVSSLDEGLVVIGHDILKDIIITSCSAKFYKGNVGAGYDLGQGELGVARAGGHVDEQVVERSPDDVAEHLAHEAVHHRSAPDDRSVLVQVEADAHHLHAVLRDRQDPLVTGLGDFGGAHHHRYARAVHVCIEQPHRESLFVQG